MSNLKYGDKVVSLIDGDGIIKGNIYTICVCGYTDIGLSMSLEEISGKWYTYTSFISLREYRMKKLKKLMYDK